MFVLSRPVFWLFSRHFFIALPRTFLLRAASAKKLRSLTSKTTFYSYISINHKESSIEKLRKGSTNLIFVKISRCRSLKRKSVDTPVKQRWILEWRIPNIKRRRRLWPSFRAWSLGVKVTRPVWKPRYEETVGVGQLGVQPPDMAGHFATVHICRICSPYDYVHDLTPCVRPTRDVRFHKRFLLIKVSKVDDES